MISKEYSAYRLAMKDIKEEIPFKAIEPEEFYDERKSTKQDVFYEEGDGALEISFKKLIKMITNKNKK